MPNFTFKGKNRQGEIIAGERVAENRGALALALRREQIMLTEAAEKKAAKFNFEFGGNANAKDLAVFTRQFSVMIDAGVPLVQSLEILGEQQDKKKFQAVIKAVQRDVESGSNLANAMKTHDKTFDDLYTNMPLFVRPSAPLTTSSSDGFGIDQLTQSAVIFRKSCFQNFWL